MKSKKLPKKSMNNFASMSSEEARPHAAKLNRQRRTEKPSIYDDFYDDFDSNYPDDYSGQRYMDKNFDEDEDTDY